MKLRKKKTPIRIIRITRDYETPEPPKQGSNRALPRRRLILNLLRDYPHGLTRAEIARETGYANTCHASGILRNMLNDGLLIKEYNRYYLNTHKL